MSDDAARMQCWQYFVACILVHVVHSVSNVKATPPLLSSQGFNRLLLDPAAAADVAATMISESLVHTSLWYRDSHAS